MLPNPAKRERSDRSVPLFEFSLPAESLVDLSAFSPLTMPVQAAWKQVEKSAAAFGQPETPFALSESDFPFLDTKAEVDQYKPNKGRRHGGEQLIAKKVQGQSFVIKQVVGQGPRNKTFGKKRRARLLSDNSEDLHLNVPYSLNRKNRWEVENAGDFLRNQHAAQDVQLTAIDQNFTVGTDLTAINKRDILAFHQLEQNGDINTRTARSTRGSTLAEMQPADEQQKPLALRFVLAKPHPLSKSVAANSFKNKPMSRSTRRAQIDVSVYSTDGELNEEEAPPPTANTEETTRMYAPKHQTFSLADFICEKAAPVIVRPPRRVGGVPVEEYVQIEMPEVSAEDSNSGEAKQTIETNKMPLAGVFRTIQIPTTKLGIQSRADWIEASRVLAERADLRFRWLNSAQAAFQVDVTALLSAEVARSSLCVLTFSHRLTDGVVDVLINAAVGCAVDVPTIDSAVKNGLDDLLQLVLKNTRNGASDDEFKSSNDLRLFSSDFNSVQLAAAVQPVSDYAMLSGKFEAEEDARPQAQPQNDAEIDEDLEGEEEDDFEHVDFNEFETPDTQLETTWIDANLDEQVAEMRTICDECGENALHEIIRSDMCGHSFCRRCLKQHIRPRLSKKTADVLECPFDKCTATIPAVLLQSVLPLSWVVHSLRIVAAHHAASTGRLVHICPAGCGLGLVEEGRLRYAHVFCAICKNHRCRDCQFPPHWPLNCTQARIWSEKRDLQADLAENNPKRISAQFWTVCDDIRQRRLNSTAMRAIAKDARKIGGYKFERKFVELRKACLQVVENGFAWLYMNRNGADRPANWSNAKAALTTLLNEFNLLENAVVRGGQNADKLAELMQKVRGFLHKSLIEIASSSVGGTEKDDPSSAP